MMRGFLKVAVLIAIFSVISQSGDLLAAADSKATPAKTSLAKKLLRRTCYSMVGIVGLTGGAVLVGPYVWDYRLTPSEQTTKTEMDKLAYKMSSQFQSALGSRSFSSKRDELRLRMQNLKPILDSFDKFQNIFIIRKEDYFIPVPFIDPNLKVSGKNTFGAYKRFQEEVQLRGFHGENHLVFDLAGTSSDELLKLLEPYYAKVETPSLTSIEESNAAEGFSSSATRYKFSRGDGHSDEKELKVQAFVNHLSQLASPLFLEIIKRPDNSISQEELFDMAMRIYHDPWTSVGMISFITGYDAFAVDRDRACIVARKVKPVVTPQTNDRAGSLYHFWNYIARAIYYDGTFRDNHQSWGYEEIHQGDRDERIADRFGMQVGSKIIHSLH